MSQQSIFSSIFGFEHFYLNFEELNDSQYMARVAQNYLLRKRNLRDVTLVNETPHITRLDQDWNAFASSSDYPSRALCEAVADRLILLLTLERSYVFISNQVPLSKQAPSLKKLHRNWAQSIDTFRENPYFDLIHYHSQCISCEKMHPTDLCWGEPGVKVTRRKRTENP